MRESLVVQKIRLLQGRYGCFGLALRSSKSVEHHLQLGGR